MTVPEAKQLKVDDQVRWVRDDMPGHVVEIGYAAVKIAWQDGRTAIFNWADEDQLALVERV